MIRFYTITLVFLFFRIASYSQQTRRINNVKNASILTVLKTFENQYQLDFSYDVEAIKDIKLKVDQDSISINELKILLKKQTPFKLQQVGDRSFIFIENNETIEVCGVLVDAVSSFELTEANILKNNKVIKLTDHLGKFRLELSLKDSISISYLGYTTKTIKAATFSASCDTIRLRPQVHNLNQIVINEYLTEGIQKNKDASVNVSIKKLRILPGLVEPDVLQSLQLLPGINSPTEDPAGLYIRGGTPDQNLVLWDGIKIYQTGHFFNQISTFNPYIVKNTKVYRGGTSVRYGDRISGTIIIDSDDDLTEEFKIGGGVNFTHADVYAKVPLSKKVGILGAFRRSTTDLYDNIRFNNISQKVFQNTRADNSDDSLNNILDQEREPKEDTFSFYDGNFKTIWKPNENNNITLSTLFSENILNNVSLVKEIDQEDFSEEDFYKISNAGASLNWKKKYLNNIDQKATIYFSSFNTKYNIDRLFSDEVASYEYRQNNDVIDIGASYSLDIPIAKKQFLAIGYQYVYNETAYFNKQKLNVIGEYELSDENNINGHNNNHTLYSEYNYKGTKLDANIGLRGSYLSRQDNLFIEPRLFTSVEIFKDFRITASAELKNQQITTYSDFGSTQGSIRGLPIADTVFVLSGEVALDDDVFTIPVIKSQQFTFGTLYTYNGWNFDIEGYYKNLRGITSFNNPILEFAASNNSNEAVEIGKETRIGLDFLLKKRIKNYRFWLGYSLSKTLVNFPSIQESFFPGDFDQRHVFNISQTLKVKDFEFALGWNYSSGRPFTKLISNENVFLGLELDPNGINANRFKDFHRLDASVVYRFKIEAKKPWSGMLGFSLRNIYNRENTLEQGFREIGTEEDIIDVFERKSLRLTPDLVVRFNF